MRRTAAPLLLMLTLAGCAYYNGMYNANRLVRQAEKAEREGRTFDANSFWGQAGVKADSVLTRHGKSKWADDALFIRGKSYQRLGDCTSAVTSFRRLLSSSTDSTLMDEASFLLGRCYQQLGDPRAASDAYARLVNSRHPERRREALYQHGHSLVLGGRFEQALAELEQTDHPRAAGERAAALAGLGRTQEALRIADSLVAANDTAASWDLLTNLVGGHDPLAASELVTRVVAIPHMRPEITGSLLLADGRRLATGHPDLALKQYRESIRLAPGAMSASDARLALLRLRMAGTASIDSLPLVQQEFPDVQQIGGNTGILVARFDRAALLIRDLVDSVSANAAGSDMRLFLAGEVARDSLEMPGLARELLARVARDYPDSPYTPKALLALVALNPGSADSARAVLQERYPASPYLLAWSGQLAPDFTQLEDSLANFTSSIKRPVQNTRPTTRPAQGGLPLN